MKKLTCLMTFLCLMTMSVMAKSIVFTLSDDAKVYYLLGGETNPILRFIDGKVTINTDQYEISDIKNFYISNEDDPTAIENVLATQQVQFRANTLIINAADVKTVKVYAVGGTEVQADVQQQDDLVSIHLDALSSGLYVISTGKASFKVMKK